MIDVLSDSELTEIDALSEASLEGDASENFPTASSNTAALKLACKVVIIEKNKLLRECLGRNLNVESMRNGASYSCLAELLETPPNDKSVAILLSTMSLSTDEAANELHLLSKTHSKFRTMVLGKTDAMSEAIAALSQGANGYISVNAGLDTLIQATAIVSGGGTYVPAPCLFAAEKATSNTAEQSPENGITNRELGVIQGIRQGKPNKVIAYDLNVCESTVKVHVRNIMKKLHAKNRTDIAIKSANLMPSSSRVNKLLAPNTKAGFQWQRRSSDQSFASPPVLIPPVPVNDSIK